MLTPSGDEVIIHGAAGAVDDDGYPLPAQPDVMVVARSVQPMSLEEITALDRNGIVDAIRLWLPSGTAVSHGDEVTVRGVRWRVERSSWDWGMRRRPVLRRHRPSVVVDCVRGVG